MGRAKTSDRLSQHKLRFAPSLLRIDTVIFGAGLCALAFGAFALWQFEAPAPAQLGFEQQMQQTQTTIIAISS